MMNMTKHMAPKAPNSKKYSVRPVPSDAGYNPWLWNQLVTPMSTKQATKPAPP